MAGSVFGRLSLEEGDSANSLEGLEIKLGGEGKNTYPYLLGVWGGCRTVYKTDEFSRYVFCHRLGQIYLNATVGKLRFKGEWNSAGNNMLMSIAAA